MSTSTPATTTTSGTIMARDDGAMRQLILLLNQLEPYYVLLIAAVGLVGNSISFILFVFTKLRLKEVHTVLAFLAVVDNGFLVVLVLVTLKHFGVDFVNGSELGCKLSVFLPYLFGFLSIWLIVLFSVERFIVVCFPFKRGDICTQRRNIQFTMALATFAVAFYSYGVWTTELVVAAAADTHNATDLAYTDSDTDADAPRYCMTKEAWLGFLKVMSALDAVLTMVVPFLLIFTFNLLIITRLRRKHRLSVCKAARLPQSTYTSDTAPDLTTTCSSSAPRRGSLSSESSSGRTEREDEHQEATPGSHCEPPEPPRSPVVPPSPVPVSARRLGSKPTTTVNSGGDGGGSLRLVRKKCLVDEEINITHLIERVNSTNKSLAKSLKRKRIKAFIRSNYQRPDVYTTRSVRLFSAAPGDKISPRTKMYSKTTRMLLIISATFFCLHGPTALLKLWYFVAPWLLAGWPRNALIEELAERLTCYVYYLHYSLNFFLYVLNLKKFRKAICERR